MKLFRLYFIELRIEFQFLKYRKSVIYFFFLELPNRSETNQSLLIDINS